MAPMRLPRAARASASMSSPRARRRIDALVIGLLIAGMTLLCASFALRVTTFQPDEQLYLALSRFVAQHFPSALWSSYWPRGLQRLDEIILALPFAFLRGPGAFEFDHVVQCILFASTALPVFLLVRQAGLARRAALLAAALSVIVPWAVTATSYLAEPATYPAYAWVIYTVWLTTRRPSWQHDVLSLVAIVVAAFCRTQMLAVAAILPIAIVWHEWSWGLATVPRARRLRAIAPRLWQRHRLLVALVATALVAFLAGTLGVLPSGGLNGVLGSYGLPSLPSLSVILAEYRYYLACMIIGTGLFAFALALPWACGALLRPRDGDGDRHSVAVVCTLGVAAILGSLVAGGPDERYVMYGAVPIAVAAVWALEEWAAAPRAGTVTRLAGALAGGLAVVLLLNSEHWGPLTDIYNFFAYPAATFFQRVLLLRFAATVRGHIPIVQPSSGLIVYGTIFVCVAAFAIVGSRARMRRLSALLMACALFAVCATETLYTLDKFTETAGVAPSWTVQSWVDERVPSGTFVGGWVPGWGQTPDYVPLWLTTQVWNTSLMDVVYFGAEGYGSYPTPLGTIPVPVTLQSPSGILRSELTPGEKTPWPIPRYMLISTEPGNQFGLQGRLVAMDPYLALKLLKLSTPIRLDWSIVGTNVFGQLPSGRRASAVIYDGALAGGGPRCATFSLSAPYDLKQVRWPYLITMAGRTVRTGTLGAQQTVTTTVRLPDRPAGDRAVELITVRVKGAYDYEGMPLGAIFGPFAVNRCAGTRAS